MCLTEPQKELLKIQRMHPYSGDVMIITSKMDMEKTREFANQVRSIVGEGVQIIVTDQAFQIEHFDEETMNKAGWFRQQKHDGA